jgi:hypothetical protein
MLLGSEFSVGVFIHPTLARVDHERFLPAIQVFAALFGKIMPFWMGATLLLHLFLLVGTWSWPEFPTVLLPTATLLWLGIILFSVVGPVPINNQVKAWDNRKLPPDRQEQRRRWDRPECNSGSPDRLGVSRVDPKLQDSCHELIDEQRMPLNSGVSSCPGYQNSSTRTGG